MNWFEFETRMRRLVVELLEPTLRKITEDRESLEKFKNKSNATSASMKIVENLLGFGNNKSGWMDDIEKRVEDLSVRVAEAELKLNNKLQIYDTIFEKKNIELSVVQKRLEGIDERISEIDKHLELLSVSQITQSNLTKDFLEKFKDEFSEKYRIVIHEATSTQSKSENINNRINDILSKINDFQKIFDRHRLMINDVNGQIQKCFSEKITYEDLHTETSKISLKVLQINETSIKNTNTLEDILKYINVFLPADIQACISDNIYSFAEKSALIKFSDYEENILKENEMHEYSDIDIEDTIKRSIGANLRIIKRHNDFIFNEVTKKKEQLAKTKPNIYIKRRIYNVAIEKEDQAEAILSDKKEDQADLNNSSLENFFLQSKFALISEQINKLRNELFSSQEQHKIYLDMIRNEWEEAKGKIHEERHTLISDYHLLLNDSSKIESSNKKVSDEIKMIKCFCKEIIEINLITYHLLLQDEEDKKSIHLTGMKDRTKEPQKPIIDFDQEKFLCQGSQIWQAFKIACLAYNPTPLFYRETLYQRQELIEHMGNIIKSSWMKIIPNSNIKEKKIIELQKKNPSRARLNSSYTSRKKIQSFG